MGLIQKMGLIFEPFPQKILPQKESALSKKKVGKTQISD